MSKYMKRFFAEKDLPVVNFEWVASDGTHHLMTNEYVIQLLTDHTTGRELQKIKKKLVYLDFKNADINDYLFFLAKQFVESELEA